MKCISLWQPWASLWVSGVKIHETRHWPTSHRGELLVHAAKRKPDGFDGDRLDEICDGMFGHHWGMDLPRGAIVGMVRLVACKRTDEMRFVNQNELDDQACGDFHPGRYAWERDTFTAFANPIPYRGQQGMWEVPDAIVQGALAA